MLSQFPPMDKPLYQLGELLQQDWQVLGQQFAMDWLNDRVFTAQDLQELNEIEHLLLGCWQLDEDFWQLEQFLTNGFVPNHLGQPGNGYQPSNAIALSQPLPGMSQQGHFSGASVELLSAAVSQAAIKPDEPLDQLQPDAAVPQKATTAHLRLRKPATLSEEVGDRPLPAPPSPPVPATTTSSLPGTTEPTSSIKGLGDLSSFLQGLPSGEMSWNAPEETSTAPHQNSEPPASNSWRGQGREHPSVEFLQHSVKAVDSIDSQQDDFNGKDVLLPQNHPLPRTWEAGAEPTISLINSQNRPDVQTEQDGLSPASASLSEPNPEIRLYTPPESTENLSSQTHRKILGQTPSAQVALSIPGNPNLEAISDAVDSRAESIAQSPEKLLLNSQNYIAPQQRTVFHRETDPEFPLKQNRPTPGTVSMARNLEEWVSSAFDADDFVDKATPESPEIHPKVAKQQVAIQRHPGLHPRTAFSLWHTDGKTKEWPISQGETELVEGSIQQQEKGHTHFSWANHVPGMTRELPNPEVPVSTAISTPELKRNLEQGPVPVDREESEPVPFSKGWQNRIEGADPDSDLADKPFTDHRIDSSSNALWPIDDNGALKKVTADQPGAISVASAIAPPEIVHQAPESSGWEQQVLHQDRDRPAIPLSPPQTFHPQDLDLQERDLTAFSPQPITTELTPFPDVVASPESGFDLDEVMEALTREIARDYHRFYGG